MSDIQPRVRGSVAPRHRQESPATGGPAASDLSGPPILVRLPNLSSPSSSVPAPYQAPDVPEALAAPETSTEADTPTVQQREPAGECREDADRQHDVSTRSKQDAALDTVPDDTTAVVSRDKRRSDASVKTRRQRRWERATAAADWRSPAYKLGGTLVAAVLVVIVLLALNRRREDPASSSLRGTSAPDVAADGTGVPDVDVTLGTPTDDVISEPQPGALTAADEQWLAESPASPPPKVSTDTQPRTDTSQDDAVVRLGPNVASTESPGPETANSWPQVADATATNTAVTYDTASDAAWSYRNAGPDPGPRPGATADLPPRGQTQAGQTAQLPSPVSGETTQRVGGQVEPVLPQRFQRGEPAGPVGARASSWSDQQRQTEVATTQTYPSTPYRAMFPNRDGNLADRGRDVTPVRTAERDAVGYPRPSQRQMDATGASAQLQGRIEPFTTGSHEHYR